MPGSARTELLIIVGVLVLLFGAKKLPELARGSGRALRIFKAETKGLHGRRRGRGRKTPEQREIDARNRADLEPERAGRADAEPDADDAMRPATA